MAANEEVEAEDEAEDDEDDGEEEDDDDDEDVDDADPEFQRILAAAEVRVKRVDLFTLLPVKRVIKLICFYFRM